MTLILPYIGKNHPTWLIFFRGIETTNQVSLATPTKIKKNKSCLNESTLRKSSRRVKLRNTIDKVIATESFKRSRAVNKKHRRLNLEYGRWQGNAYDIVLLLFQVCSRNQPKHIVCICLHGILFVWMSCCSATKVLHVWGTWPLIFFRSYCTLW